MKYQVFGLYQHCGERIAVSLKLPHKLLLHSRLSFCGFLFFFVFIPVCKDKMVAGITESLQTFLDKKYS